MLHIQRAYKVSTYGTVGCKMTKKLIVCNKYKPVITARAVRSKTTAAPTATAAAATDGEERSSTRETEDFLNTVEGPFLHGPYFLHGFSRLKRHKKGHSRLQKEKWRKFRITSFLFGSFFHKSEKYLLICLYIQILYIFNKQNTTWCYFHGAIILDVF